jgi:hypothetical protein
MPSNGRPLEEEEEEEGGGGGLGNRISSLING